MVKYPENIHEADENDVDISSFKLKPELNDKFWNGDRLDIMARRKMLTIARDFITKFKIADFSIIDVVMTGSLANYNWNEKYSDIDLHIVVDFEEINDDTELVSEFFDAVKTNWNNKHKNINIYGYPVEIYVQDKNEKHVSSGVYSVLYDEWITKPSLGNMEKSMSIVGDSDIKAITSSIMTDIEETEERLETAIENNDIDEIEDVGEDAHDIYDRIKELRKSGLGMTGSELSQGNLIFKTLRRNGYIEKLRDIKRSVYDYIHSLK